MRYSLSLKKEIGFTLIELMIAITLGLLLTAGMIGLFVNSKQTYRVQENLSRMQENARFAMEFLIRDIRMADYSGCLRESLSNATNHLDTAGTNYDVNIHLFDNNIAGTNGTAGANLALDSPDSITIRTAVDSGLSIESPFGPQASANIKVAAGNTLSQGDVVLISDCTQADIFQISNANPSSGTIVHNTGNSTEPGNTNAGIATCPGGSAHCLSKVYQDDASILRLSSMTYTIQNGIGGMRALFRNGDELIEGIENMQIRYGEDANADNTADYFVSAATGGLDMNQVVSIRVSLLVRSLDDNLTTQAQPYTYNTATVTPSDRRFRQVFTSTIAVRNRLP
ncbi:MAG: type IV pilus assembly protein PilW [Methylophagaceae bacterium]|jgi:type IV pilus assembly protein PilW